MFISSLVFWLITFGVTCGIDVGDCYVTGASIIDD